MRRAPALVIVTLTLGASLSAAQAQPASAYPDEILVEVQRGDRPPPADDAPSGRPPGPPPEGPRPLCLPAPGSGTTRPCPLPPPARPGMAPLEEGAPCRCGEVDGTVRNGPPRP